MSDYQIETRRRSRSKTPFLRSACDHENCDMAGEEGHTHHHHHHKKKTAAAPNVNTIVEEASEATTSSEAKRQTRAKTSDYSSEENSPEGQRNTRQNSARASKATTTTTTTTTTIIKKKAISDEGVGATSTPKANNSLLSSFAARFTGSVGRAKEIVQNESNTELERSLKDASNTSASLNNSHNQSGFFRRLLNSTYNSNSNNSPANFTGQLSANSEHLAYQVYKEAGEYWNKTKKTDYTYSELSRDRTYLAPGVVAMPNMSRRGLYSHGERVQVMIQQNPAEEEFIRRRYDYKTYAERRQETERLLYDSGDEVDNSLRGYTRKRQFYNSEDASWLVRVITTIVTSWTTAWQTVTGGGAKSGVGLQRSPLYGTRYAAEERGFFGSIAHGISSVFLALLRYVYLFIGYVLCLDTWLLQSSNVDNKNRKRFLLLLLILLPLLLLAAWSLLSAGERNAYYQKTQALLPLSLLATLRSNLYAAGSSSLQGIRELPALTLNAFSQFASKDGNSHHLHIHNIQGNMQKALTAEEYENILNHVNEYVQRLVDIKLQDQREQEAQLHRTQPISEAQMQVIVKVIQENLSRFAREREDTLKFKFSDLSEADLQRLVSLVRLQLEQSNWATNLPVRLTSENIEEIKKLIQQNIEVNNHAHYTLLVERIDLDALLKRILVAPELARFVDGRINIAIDEQRLKFTAQQESSGTEPATATALDEQHRLINALNSEIAFIKLALADKVSENADLQQSISSLKFSQDDLLKRIQEHELSTDKRFSALLAEIERKLATLNETQFTLFNKQIKLSLVEILGFKQDGKFEDIDLQNWVRNIFVAKDYLEQRLVELSSRMNDRFKDETDRLGVLLMRNISEQLKHEILLTVETRHKESMANLKGHITSSFDEDEVRRIVKSVLAVYDADKTGLADFALESAGGTVLSTRCTESYQTKTAQVSIFGIPLWYPSNTPRTAISPNVQPGNCWAFQGFPGFLVLKLNSLIYVTGFTMEHIPRSLSPTGTIASAPRNFTVWALEHEKDFDPIQYGEYEYLDNGASLQYFPVQNQDIKRPYQFVELRIETNHGHPTYTCLYRFRVHGKPAET